MAGNPVNWLFLAELIVVVIVVTAFLFYWNRILGSALALLIRFITWRVFGVYLVIGSFQISPLAGRISFRDVEYHSSNLQFRILHGNVTFRYWKLRVRHDGDSASHNRKRSRLPCRIAVDVQGVEIFCYNRTPAYDAIVERMKRYERQDAEEDDDLSPCDSATASATTSAHAERPGARQRKSKPVSRQTSKSSPSTSNEGLKGSDSRDEEQSYPPRPNLNTTGEPSKVERAVNWLWESLPMSLKITTGSVVLGSDATPMVLIIDYKRAEGTVEMSEPRSACDLYKLSINVGLQDVTVLMRTNVDYSGPLLAHGKNVYDQLLKRDPQVAKEAPSVISSFPGFRWLAKRFLFLYDPRFSSPPVAGIPDDQPWKGLARYRAADDATGGAAHREERQYAKVTTLLSTRALDFTYYSDTPGLVPEPGNARDIDPNDEVGNIEPAPEWGIDVVLHGGNVNYGPWADRQRDALQKAFAPSIFFDSEPRKKLRPGDTRVHAMLVVNVSMTDKTTLRIPTREPSKDWMYDSAKGDLERRYGWLDVVVGSNSSVCYTQSQIATPHGYDSMVVMHLDSLDMASSVNLQSFIVAKACKLSITMPTPLFWNAQRNWGIDLTLDTPDILLMREHVALITDLSKDWSSGATGDFRHFVPMHYSFRISLIKYAIHLFINDFNIVDVPRSRDHNAFLDIRGPRLDSYAAVSSTRYKPEFSIVPFTVDAKDVNVDITLPSWDTHRTFGHPALEVGKIGDVHVGGSYRYYSRPSPDHLEKLTLHLDAERVAYKALGWVVRRMFCVKDNYFGGFTQFSTMQEYLEKFDHSPDSVGDPVEQKYRPGRSDPFSVQLTVDVRDSLVLMSDEIYGCDKGVSIPIPQLQLELKTNEFQMDLALDVAPTYVVACSNLNQSYAELAAPLAKDQDVVFIEGINIKASRLFGPQPRATTYFCLWELSLARISAFLSPEFKGTLAAVGTAIGYNYPDHDNAPASIYLEETPPDATFVKLNIQHVTALLSAGNSAIAVELPKGVFIDTSSMASKACRSVMGLGIPALSVHILNRRDRRRRWEPVGSISTGLSLDNYRVPKGWEEDAVAQQEFLRHMDAPTMRVPYLYGVHDDRAPGRHRYDVYAPRPRPVMTKWADDTANSDEDTEGEESSEFNASSDSAPSIPVSKLSRRKRGLSVSQVMEAQELAKAYDSVGDESDTVSSISTSSFTSSGTSSQESDEDMATILEDRLRSFRKIHQRSRRLSSSVGAHDPPLAEDTEPPFVPLTVLEGGTFRINLEKSFVELNPDTLRAAVDVAGAMRTMNARPEVLLDELLSYHVSAVRKGNKQRGSSLFDINVPMVDLRVVMGNFHSPESLVHCSLGAPSVRFVQSPVPDSAHSTTTATVGVQTVQLTLSRRDTSATTVSLLDVPLFEAPVRHDKLLPFVRLSSTQLGLTYRKAPREQTIQLKTKDSDLQAATPGISIVGYLVDTWGPVVDNLPSHCAALSSADIIYDTLRDTAAAGTFLSLPAFMYESPYALQFNDQRDLRHDVGWFTLTRLRHWRRTNKNPAIPPLVPPLEKAKIVVNELCQLDKAAGVNEEVIVTQPYLRKAFGSCLEVAGLTPESRMESSVNVFATAESLAVRHYGRLLDTGAIASSAVTVEGLSVVNQRVKTWEKDIPSTSMRVLVTNSKLDLDLHNSLVSVVLASMDQADSHRTVVRQLPVAKALDHTTSIVLDVNLGEVALGVTAGGLRLDVHSRGAQGSATFERSQRTGTESQVLIHNAVLINCSSIEFVLREAVDPSRASEVDRALMVMAIRGVRCSADQVEDNLDTKGGSARLLLGVDALEFDSRPQLKAFFDFGQDWRRNHYPLYVPALEQIQAAIARKKVIPSPTHTPKPSIWKSMVIDVYLGSVRMQARAAKGLWLGWDMGQVYASRQGSSDHLQFGLRIDPQVVGAYTSAKRVKTKDSSVIRLPSVTITGNHRMVSNRPHLTAMVNLGMFTGILKPAVLDRLLTLHRRMGSDVLEVIREYRGFAGGVSQPQEPKANPLVFRVQASVDGVRFGLRADNVPTTLMFEALQLQGSASNAETTSLQWTAKANHVGLSLIRLADGPSYQTAQPLNGTRSVSMVFDISAEEIPGSHRAPSQLSVKLSRVHTVMHVAALSELGDLFRSWSSDISLLREVHGEEVAEVKEQTAKVLKKLEGAHAAKEKEKDPASVGGGSNPDNAAAIESWFAARLLNVEVTGIGIAIPLDAGASIDVSQRSTTGSGPALLYSTHFVGLKTSRTETARFRVQQTFLQFVDEFNPSVNEHFQGPYHSSTNYMVLPNIDSEAQMTATPETLNINAHCSATDFKLSLTPEIADCIARLTDLYDHGKEHLSAMEREYRAQLGRYEPGESVAAKYDMASTLRSQRQKVAVTVSFRFDSGVVELHRKSVPEKASIKPLRRNTKWGLESHHDRFILPTVSIWMDYSGALEGCEDESRTLLFNMAVHESRNVLHPTILPFLVEIVSRVEQRAKTRPVRPAPPVPEPSPEVANVPITERAIERIAEAPTGKMRLRMTLRIDRSELRLSCAPDSNAYVDLKWESGGFVASTLLGGKDTTTLSGSVSGVTAYLSHEFAEHGRGCIEAGAKDLAFSITLCSEDVAQRGLSIVLDTEVSVKFRLEAYSAWLIFMSVWVDNAPKFGMKRPADSPPVHQAVGPLATSKLGFAALIRFRSIDFDANVAVTQARLEMTPIVLRTRSDGEKAEVDLSIGVTQATARGDISGDLRSESLRFSTVRRSSRATFGSDAHVLRMSIEGGDLRGNLFIGDKNIVRFQLRPSVVTLVDNWKDHAEDASKQVMLDFIVDAGDFYGVVRLPVIPRLLGHFYQIFDMAESQHRIAAQRSEMFKSRSKHSQADRTPKTSVMLPLSPTDGATVVSQTTAPLAPNRAHVKTAQLMRFALSGIDIGIFADDYDDGSVADFYRFYIGRVSADLKRQEDEDGRPQRDLKLHIAFVEWQTSDGKRAARAEKHDMIARELIDAAVHSGHREVVILPLMSLEMASTEYKTPHELAYDFDVVWGPTDGDIKILPNFFEAAFKSFRALIRGIDEQALARARRRGIVRTKSAARLRKETSEGNDEGEAKAEVNPLQYKRRGPGPFSNPVPKLRALGETTGEAAMMIPRIKRAMGELPAYSHRFVTAPLENGMDILLKLYERQLPDLA